ncbi:hypothetical protein, partial [Proteus faecis]|uniref:hypothetical protein n=1 Tax=Proteus faecis TaxID=2050967 RepID=UPI003075DE8F
ADEEYETHVTEDPSEEWHESFQFWFHRMKKCIDAKGDYFEKHSINFVPFMVFFHIHSGNL